MTPEKAANVLAKHFGVPVEELLEDFKQGRLHRERRAPKPPRLRCGDHPVFDIADPRHKGKIVSILNQQYRDIAVATVRWFGSGWLSEVPLKNLRKDEQ